MKKSILITAVAGTGKSTACKALYAAGYNAIDIESIDGLYELVDEKTGKVLPGNMDQISEGIDWNCNKERLQRLVDAQTTDLAFYCGGMSNTDEIWDVFDRVIMFTVSDGTTIKRLSTRQPGEFGSTQVNRDWVLSWKHELEQRWIKNGCLVVNAESNPHEVVEAIVGIMTA